MSFIAGLLFNHFTLAIVVILGIILAIGSLSGKLIMNKYVLSLLLITSIGWGLYGYGYTGGEAAQLKKDTVKITALEKTITGYEVAIKAQKEEAAKILSHETTRVKIAETRLKSTLATQEKINETNKQKNKLKDKQLNDLVAINDGRLRDPAGCGRSGESSNSPITTGTNDSARNRTDASGLLSPELTRLLLENADKSDQINLAYISSRVYGRALHDALIELSDTTKK